jgi:hypothetical protein
MTLTMRTANKLLLMALLIVGAAGFGGFAQPSYAREDAGLAGTAHTRAASPNVAVWCVDDANPPVQTGAPCANASTLELPTAISLAAPDDEIRLAGGTFTGTGSAVAVVDKPLTITGGYAGGTNGWGLSQNSTSSIIDGNGVRKALEVVGSNTVTIGQVVLQNGGVRNDAGTVLIPSGATLNLSNGGSSNGLFSVSGTLMFPAGPHTFQTGVQVTGTGNLHMRGGTLTIGGMIGAHAVNVNNLYVESGTLDGSGTITVNARFTWIGGTLGGGMNYENPGYLVLSSGTQASIAGVGSTKTVVKRIIQNYTNLYVNGTGTGTLVMSDRAEFNNYNGALFEIQNNDSVNYGTGERPEFNNMGTVRKSAGTGVSNLGTGFLLFVNDGLVQVQTGTLNLGGGANGDPLSTGQFQVSALAKLRFSGTHDLGSASSVTGGGEVEFSAGTTDVAGTYDVGVTYVIGTGLVNFETTAETVGLSIGNTGNLSGGGTVNADVVIWTSGTMSGSGVTNLSATGVMTIGGVTSSKFLSQRTFNNYGTARVNGTGVGTLYINNNATFTNHPSALFEIQNNDSVLYNAGTLSTFNNYGTVRKSAGSLMSTFGSGNLAFNNNGAVEVLTGTLSLDGGASGGTTSTGTFTLAPQTTLRWNAGIHTLQPQSQISGAGNVTFSGGTTSIAGTYSIGGLTTISGGTVNFNTNATTGNANQSGGTWGGDAGFTFTITGIFNWTGGTINGLGTTTIAPGAVMNLGGVGTVKNLQQRTFNNNGTTYMNGTNVGSLAVGSGALFYNNAGALFEIQNNDSVTFNTGVSSVFTNTGMIRKTGGAATSQLGTGNLAFNNVGDVEIMTGTLSLNGGGVSPGSFSVGQVAVLKYNGGTHTLQPGAEITGAGNVEFGMGVVNIAGAYDITGSTIVAGGTANFNTATATTTDSAISSGTLGGTGIFTVTGTMNWTGGTQMGTGRTDIAPGAFLNLGGVASTKTLSGRTFNNWGTAVTESSGVGILQLASAATFNNRVGGTFHFQNNDTVTAGSGAVSTFNNMGTVLKSLDGGSATLGTGNMQVLNSGTLNVLTGILNVAPSFTQSAGTTNLAGGNINTTGTLLIAGGTLSGSGIITGTVQNSGLITPGDSPTSGELKVSGAFRQNAGGTLNVEIGGRAPVAEYDRFLVSGVATLSGTLNISMTNDFVPVPGDQFALMTYSTRSGSFTTINGLNLGGGRIMSPVYNPNNFTVWLPGGPTMTPTAGTPQPTPVPTTCPITFTDVDNTNTFYPFVRCLACRGIISGYADGTFRPGNDVTRGQLSKIVSNAAGWTDPVTSWSFEDVPASSTFYIFVERMASRGVIGGYACGGAGEPCVAPDNRPYFRAGANATRGQISKIVANAAGFGDDPGPQLFEDVPTSNTFFTFIQRLANRGIMGGYVCGGPGETCIPPANRPYFRSGNNATRGQVSKIVSNSFFPNCQTP